MKKPNYEDIMNKIGANPVRKSLDPYFWILIEFVQKRYKWVLLFIGALALLSSGMMSLFFYCAGTGICYIKGLDVNYNPYVPLTEEDILSFDEPLLMNILSGKLQLLANVYKDTLEIVGVLGEDKAFTMEVINALINDVELGEEVDIKEVKDYLDEWFKKKIET